MPKSPRSISSLAWLPFVLLLTLASERAEAAGNAAAKIMLHVLTTTTKNQCSRPQNLPANCNGFAAGVSNLVLYPNVYFAYPLVVNGSQVEGIKSAGFGIDYNGTPAAGVEIYDWTLCADTESPMGGWPVPGTGNFISFSSCQSGGNPSLGAVAVLGYFYCGAYTPDVFSITTHPVSGDAVVTNCVGQSDVIYEEARLNCSWLGRAGFGPGTAGHNPCNIHEGFCYNVETTPASWSRIKSVTR